MAKIKSKVAQPQPQSTEQDSVQHVSQSEQQALQQIVPSEKSAVQKRIEPRYPSWPTSRPGPQSTSPLAGMSSVNPLRPEQVAEIAYNQEKGQPSVDSSQHSVADASIHGSTSSDSPKNAQDALGKRKQRL
jgi:hypothetical protein